MKKTLIVLITIISLLFAFGGGTPATPTPTIVNDTNQTNSSIDYSCNENSDCVLIGTQNNDGQITPKFTCGDVDYSKPEYVAVNKKWFTNWFDAHKFEAPSCPQRTTNGKYAAECIQNNCQKIPENEIQINTNTENNIKVSCTQNNLQERASCLANLKPEDWNKDYPLYAACDKYYNKNLQAFNKCQERAEKANDCRMKANAKIRTECVNRAFKELNSKQKTIWNRLFTIYYLEYKMQKLELPKKAISKFIENAEKQKFKVLTGINTQTYNKIISSLINQYKKYLPSTPVLVNETNKTTNETYTGNTNITTGISGKITLSPICPVENVLNPDPNCQPKPYKATIIVKPNENGKEITRFTSNENGIFNLELEPGTYYLEPQYNKTSQYPFGKPQTVKIVQGKITQIEIQYDTGIR